MSPLDVHVLKKTAPPIGQSLLSGIWLPIDRWCLVWAETVKVWWWTNYGGEDGDGAKLRV